MNGGETKKPQGYTIVEVMIVLAISSVMFLIAAVFISGKQATAQFTQGAHDMSSQLETIIQQVSDGQYPAGQSFNCSGVTTPITVVSGSNGQGTNSGCIFMGKVIHVLDNASGVANSYEVFSIAGLDQIYNSDPNQAYPQALDSNGSNIMGVNLTQQAQVPYSLDTKLYTTVGAVTSPAYAIGFLGSLGSGSSGNLQSGAQTVALYGVSVPAGSNETAAVNAIDAHGSFTTSPISSATVCLADGSHKASITIGSNGNQLATDLEIGQGAAAPC